MKTLFTAEAVSRADVREPFTTGWVLDVTWEIRWRKARENGGPNPELLFAGAVFRLLPRRRPGQRSQKNRHPVKDSTVRALVSLDRDDQGGYRPAVELRCELPGIDRIQAQCVMDEAHKPARIQSCAPAHLRQAGGLD